MNWTVPPTPVKIPLALPLGCEMPLGKGLTIEQPGHGVNPPSVLAT